MRLIDFFLKAAARWPDAACLSDDSRRLTYRDVAEKVDRVAASLVRSGIAAGDGVATLTPNSIDGLIACFGLLRMGGVWNSCNYRSSPNDLVHHMTKGKARAVFYHSSLADVVEQIRPMLPNARLWVCIDENRGDHFLGDWLALSASSLPPTEAYRPDDVYRVAATGGTTGAPKAVANTHLSAETNIASYLTLFRYDTPPRYLLAAPMTHAAGISSFPVFACGGSVHVLAAADAASIIDALETERITTVLLPPTVIYMMLAQPRVRERSFPDLKYMIFGASPMAPERLREAHEVFGPVICQLYGQTECSMAICYTSPEEYDAIIRDPAKHELLEVCGRPGPFADVAIMDDEGRLLGDGERGEIVVRSNIVMKGYVDDPAATAEISAHGWHHTGDVGFRTEDGFLHIVDRKRELIISGGFNVFPSEVEKVIQRNKAVLECAVIGVPDEKWGEMVVAVVQLIPGGTAAEAELIAECKAELGSVKAPKQVIFKEDLPRSAQGKVLRRVVRAEYWAGQERAI
ncbi:class I adenylate-forming enzyme family protein [Aliihoeflea sp. PC F10.4]